MEKIAVLCKSKDEWIKIWDKLGFISAWADIYPSENKDGDPGYDIVICLDISNWCRKWAAIDQGYTIISAQEYLRGRMEDNNFKIPPEPYKGCFEDIFKAGGCGNWASEGDIDCSGTTCEDCILSNSNIHEIKKYLSKENNMKENNINKNVLEVFGDLSAKEVVIIDRHFTDEMLKVIMMKQFSGEIKTACDEAEKKLNSDTEMAIGA